MYKITLECALFKFDVNKQSLSVMIDLQMREYIIVNDTQSPTELKRALFKNGQLATADVAKSLLESYLKSL